MKNTKWVRWGAVTAALIVTTPLSAQPRASVSLEDAAAIQSLVAAYARALGECRAEDFADLFVPGTGYFASGFRGHMVGRERLVALVQSERHCTAPAAAAGAPRPGGNAPTVTIESTPAGARGVANLGTAEYQDEYTKTADGWRFASRTVLIAAEKAAGLDAGELLAIYELGGSGLGDYYEADANGVSRLMTSGVRVSVTDGVVNGRAFLAGGGYDDQVYERVSPGKWRVLSSVHVPAPTQ
jgi:hypothetical protein